MAASFVQEGESNPEVSMLLSLNAFPYFVTYLQLLHETYCT
ncbi:hypothetical protein M101_3015 [Bacteroides fragilis str. 1007-1-F |nr:hypothetical protein M101_3015 [Bacteroides fragilis str. 1007-1-F \